MGCRLYRGTFVYTKIYRILFLNATGAEAVAVVAGDEWQHLTKQGDLFLGEIIATAGEITVFAQYPGEELFNSLLGYTGL